jgi:hypothetical protein
LPLGQLMANIERPTICSLPLAISLLAAEALTRSVAPVLQLALLVVFGTAVYAASAYLLARGELRAITAAFRSP